MQSHRSVIDYSLSLSLSLSHNCVARLLKQMDKFHLSPWMSANS